MPWWALSYLGCENVRTPNLDRLIGEGGMLFEKAVCQSPICLPSRISMLSGQYVSTNKQFGFTGLQDRRIPWLPELLRQHGYLTGASGKFHTASIGVDRWGFDFSAPTLPHDEDMAVPRTNTYRHYCRTHGVPWPTDQMHGHDPGGAGAARSAAADPNVHPAVQQSCKSDVPLEHGLERWTTNRMIEFLEQAAQGDKPFFGYLTYDRPHHPQPPPPEWWDRRRPDELKLPPLPPAEAITRLPRLYLDMLIGAVSLPNLGEEGFRYLLASYFALIEGIDDEIGRVMETLERLGLAENTTVIFTADHGDEAGTRGLYLKGSGVASHSLTGVPLIVRPAPMYGASPTPERPEPVELVDLCPSILAMAGIEVPERVEGRDLSGVWRGASTPDLDRAVFCEEWQQRMVRHHDWMLVFDGRADSECQLYDLADDPDQFWNRYEDTDATAVRVDLKRRLLGFLSQRLHGPFDESDIARLERGLDPDDHDVLIEHTVTMHVDSAHYCRAGLFFQGATHKLYVPFYDSGSLLLWDRRKQRDDIAHWYATRDQAESEPDRAIVEQLLDKALRNQINRIEPVSILKELPPPTPRPTLEEVKAVGLNREATLKR